MQLHASRTRYLMADPEEPDRLAAQVDPTAWVDTYLAQWLTPHPMLEAGGLRATPVLDPSEDESQLLPFGARVVELGCGPAVLLTEVQRRRPDLRCIGVDATESQLHGAARLAHVRGLRPPELLNADAVRVPLADASVDLVYARFLLQYLHEPAAVVAEAARICRARGRVVLQDLDGQLVSNYPPDPQLEPAEQLLALLAETGFNPWVGRRLYTLAHHAGLTDITVRVEPYHLIAGTVRPGVRDLWRMKLDIASRALIQGGCNPDQVSDAMAGYLAYLDRPDTLTFSVQFTVTGTSA
jgi:SAM-dependent methyltransferase